MRPVSAGSHPIRRAVRDRPAPASNAASSSLLAASAHQRRRDRARAARPPAPPGSPSPIALRTPSTFSGLERQIAALTVAMRPLPATRRRVPGLADAVAVDAAGAERIGHQRRRHDDDLDVAVGIDAAGGEPVAQLVVVARNADERPQSAAVRQAVLARSSMHRLQRRAGACGSRSGRAPALAIVCPEGVRNGHRVAAKPERHRRDGAARQAASGRDCRRSASAPAYARRRNGRRPSGRGYSPRRFRGPA